MAKNYVSKYRIRKDTPSEIKEAIAILESRGIRVLYCSKFSPIYGRYYEHNIVLCHNQIVNNDDLPDSYEVVYLYYKGGVEWASYDDPVNCDGSFLPLVFLRKERSKYDALYGLGHGSIETNKRPKKQK